MKKSIFISLLTFFLFAGGCIGPTKHPTKPKSEWGKDQADCERIVKDLYRNPDARYDHIHQIKVMKRCMKKKGWR
jgi:hypothetical protein